jgi:hypothetical protein
MSIRNFFEGPTYLRCNLTKWNTTNLTTITEENPDKSIYENVQQLINTLYELQYRLEPDLQTTTFLHNKIITSCEGSLAYQLAVSDPPKDISELIHKL